MDARTGVDLSIYHRCTEEAADLPADTASADFDVNIKFIPLLWAVFVFDQVERFALLDVECSVTSEFALFVAHGG